MSLFILLFTVFFVRVSRFISIYYPSIFRLFRFVFICTRPYFITRLAASTQFGRNLLIHSICMCRIRQFIAVLSSFFHSSLLCTLSLHPVPPISLPSFLTSCCHLFLGLPVNLFVPKFILKTFFWGGWWWILFSSILCTCPNQRNPFSRIVCW